MKRSDWKLMQNINKKGDIWVSAVLYFGLGIVVLSLILGVGMPVINRLRDKNIATQTKDLFASLDSNIRQVARGGPGTQRVLDVTLSKGELKIYDSTLGDVVPTGKEGIFGLEYTANNQKSYLGTVPNRIVWNYDSKASLSEADIPVKEGNTNYITTGGSGAYKVKFWLDYEPAIYLKMDGVKTVSSGTKLSIKNIGSRCIELNTNPTPNYDPDNSGKCTQDDIIRSTIPYTNIAEMKPRVTVQLSIIQ